MSPTIIILCGQGNFIAFGRTKLRLLTLLIALFLPFCVAAQSDDTRLLETARQAQSWTKRPWLRLGHYKAGACSCDYVSQIDATEFFLASNGKKDPRAELEETLRAFFLNPDESERLKRICQYPARYDWLRKELRLKNLGPPEEFCGELRAWLRKLDAKELTFVFAVAFLNNPASMFGHTLLRLNSASQTDTTRLLDTAISFAAETEEERGVSFAFKGLFGGYQGKFFTAPYHLHVKRYGDIENRDIWEFDLDFSNEEIRRMLLHLWELQRAYFDYYFLDENCSYHLLSLLEVARPSLELSERFPLWVIPADTIGEVSSVAGLLNGVAYRPSRATELRYRSRELKKTERTLAKELALGEVGLRESGLEQYNPTEQAKILELAAEYAAYKRQEDGLFEESFESFAYELLRERSRVSVDSQRPKIATPKVRPGQGHRSSRLRVGYGYEDPGHFLELEYRPVYHDNLDPPGGFASGAQLESFKTSFRYYPERERLCFEEFVLLNIHSTPARDYFLRPFSWMVDIGGRQRRFGQGSRSFVGFTDGGVGVSYLLPARSRFSLLGEASAGGNDRFESFVALGMGGSAQLVSSISDSLRVKFLGRSRRYFKGAYETSYELAASSSFFLSQNNAVGFKLARQREFGYRYDSVELFWNYFF